MDNPSQCLLLVNMCLLFGSVVAKSNSKKYFYHLATFTALLAFTMLVSYFTQDAFQIQNVFFNSSTKLPFIYKIAASWSNHEGSILLWYALLSIAGSSYLLYCSALGKLSNYYIIGMAMLQLLFISFIIVTSSPFKLMNFLPQQGLGLNPMLQDFALAIHPPILYLGQVCLAPIFVSAAISCFHPEHDYDIVAINRWWLNLALLALTIGIGLGAWWAYRELGWGGYWFFDPVENISLLPWLAGIGLHHAFLMPKEQLNRRHKVIFWSFAAFILVVGGLFIVRSGIISSVHAFAYSAQRGLGLAIILALLVVSASILLLVNYRNTKIVPDNFKANSYFASILQFGNIIWQLLIVIIIVALIYPIYCLLFQGIDVEIAPSYFHFVFIPVVIFVLCGAGLANMASHQWLLGIAAAIMAGVIYMIKPTSVILSLANFFAGYLILSSLVILCKKVSNYGLFLGHFGSGLLAMAISLNIHFAKEIEFIGTVGQQQISEHFKVKLSEVKFAAGTNYFKQIAVFEIEHNDVAVVLQPENRLYQIENRLSQEVDIFAFLLHDLYAVLSQVKNEVIYAKIYYQPFISFIWLSIAIIASAFTYSLTRRYSELN